MIKVQSRDWGGLAKTGGSWTSRYNGRHSLRRSWILCCRKRSRLVPVLDGSKPAFVVHPRSTSAFGLSDTSEFGLRMSRPIPAHWRSLGLGLAHRFASGICGVDHSVVCHRRICAALWFMHRDAGLDAIGWTPLTAASAFTLPPDELHVWRVSVDRVGVKLEEWKALLTAREQARLERFHFAKDARRELVSRGALRWLLQSYLGRSLAGEEFAIEGKGKPVLRVGSSDDRLEFNSSHSGDWVLLGFSHGRSLGVDLERWREIDGESIVRDYFSPAEFAAWKNVPTSSQTRFFFDGWTRKEAYLKALGVGLAKPLASFEVALSGEASSSLITDSEDELASERWQWCDLAVAAGYSAAAVVRRGITRVRQFELV